MTKPLQKWKLPQPTDIKEDNEWISIPRISRTIPFGYELDKDDPDILQPIENELNMLEEAKKYLKQYSYREVANWLSRNTGRSISHVGLKKRLDNERRRKNKVGSLTQMGRLCEKGNRQSGRNRSQTYRCKRKRKATPKPKPVSIVESIP